MVETIDYIHSNFIIVKDIKLDNILLKPIKQNQIL